MFPVQPRLFKMNFIIIIVLSYRRTYVELNSPKRQKTQKSHRYSFQGHRHQQQRAHLKRITLINYDPNSRRSWHRETLQRLNQRSYEGNRYHQQRLPLQVIMPST